MENCRSKDNSKIVFPVNFYEWKHSVLNALNENGYIIRKVISNMENSLTVFVAIKMFVSPC